MLEALEGVIQEVENLCSALACESNIWFWETVQLRLKGKCSYWSPSVDAYIKLKTALLLN